jgi:hypothetical protein
LGPLALPRMSPVSRSCPRGQEALMSVVEFFSYQVVRAQTRELGLQLAEVYTERSARGSVVRAR